MKKTTKYVFENNPKIELEYRQGDNVASLSMTSIGEHSLYTSDLAATQLREMAAAFEEVAAVIDVIDKDHGND